jgi:hypothetical protein
MKLTISKPKRGTMTILISSAFLLLASALVRWQLGAAPSASQQRGGIEISDAFVIAPPVGRTLSGYLNVRAVRPDALIGVSSPLASSAAIHTHDFEGEVVRMRCLDRITLKPGTTTALKPGGMHLMLFNVSAVLQPGATIPVTLTFEHAGEISLQLPIRLTDSHAHTH